MSNNNAKANPVNQENGKPNVGSEPGQEQNAPRVDRQNMGNGAGTTDKSTDQGRQRR